MIKKYIHILNVESIFTYTILINIYDHRDSTSKNPLLIRKNLYYLIIVFFYLL